MMLVASMTFPLIGMNGTSTWAAELGNGILEHTLLTVVGVANGWLATVPLAAFLAAAIVLAVRATPHTRATDTRLALWALLGWVVVFALGPTVAGDPVTPLHDGTAALTLVAGAAVISGATIALLRYLARRDERSAGPLVAPEPSG
jgi:predicted membrane channel-forming protein YqfA (hemolysin III family)